VAATARSALDAGFQVALAGAIMRGINEEDSKIAMGELRSSGATIFSGEDWQDDLRAWMLSEKKSC